MRSVVVGFVLFFSFVKSSIADEPFSHIAVEIQIEGDESRQPIEMRLPIYRYDREAGGIILSPEATSMTMWVPGTKNKLTISPLPDMAGFEMQERVNVAPSFDYTDSSGTGNFVQGFVEKNILTTLDGKYRFPFAYEWQDITTTLSLNRATLMVASNKTKRLEVIPAGVTRGTSLNFPNAGWNAIEAGPVGQNLWVVVFTDGPVHEPPFVPSLNDFKPRPRPIRSHFAYLMDARGFRPQPFFQWKGINAFSTLAAVKNGSLFIAYSSKALGDYKGTPQEEHTETSIWIDEKGQMSAPSVQKPHEIHNLDITVTNDSVLRWIPSRDQKRHKVAWIENGKEVKIDTIPYAPDGSYATGLRAVFSEGAYLVPKHPIPRISGPDVSTHDNPPREQPPVHLQPLLFTLFRKSGPPISLKFSHLEGADALANPKNYSVLSSRGHIWFASQGERNSKKLYLGCLPIEKILSAVRYE